MNHEKYRTNRIMSGGVMRTSCFMAKHQNSPRRRGKTVELKMIFLITLDLKGLKMNLTENEVDRTKTVGGVR